MPSFANDQMDFNRRFFSPEAISAREGTKQANLERLHGIYGQQVADKKKMEGDFQQNADLKRQMHGTFDQNLAAKREFEGTFGQREAGLGSRQESALKNAMDIANLNERGAMARASLTERGAMNHLKASEDATNWRHIQPSGQIHYGTETDDFGRHFTQPYQYGQKMNTGGGSVLSQMGVDKFKDVNHLMGTLDSMPEGPLKAQAQVEAQQLQPDLYKQAFKLKEKGQASQQQPLTAPTGQPGFFARNAGRIAQGPAGLAMSAVQSGIESAMSPRAQQPGSPSPALTAQNTLVPTAAPPGPSIPSPVQYSNPVADPYTGEPGRRSVTGFTMPDTQAWMSEAQKKRYNRDSMIVAP